MNDIQAWKINNRYKWIYFKHKFCELQKLKWWPCPIEPDIWPVIIRPVINLTGMSAKVTIAKNLKEYQEQCQHGFFATPILEGDHLSFDLEIEEGKIISQTTFIGVKDENHIGCFKYWELIEHNNTNPEVFRYINKLVKKMRKYSGPLNVECIGEHIIEAHLRYGDKNILDAYKITMPFYITPVWINPNSKVKLEDIDLKVLYPSAIDIIKDSENISVSGNKLKRIAQVLSRRLYSIS
jgi:hypothetical protein